MKKLALLFAFIVAAASAQNAVVRKPQVRQCVIENDTQSETPLADAQITGRCSIPAASTLVEIAVTASGGTPTVMVERFRPSSSAAADLLSGTLATGASGAYACAMSSTGQTCISGVTSSSTITLSNTSLLAGDLVRVKSATAGGTATWHSIIITYQIN